MSSSRGNAVRTRPQKYKNKTSFKNDLHDTSNKIKFLNSLDVVDVCKRCKDIIEWKIKYKKYKPLTSPKKCVSCEQKAIKFAYHVLCKGCAGQKNVCAKCCKEIENEQPDAKCDVSSQTNTDAQENLLKNIPERKCRTLLRLIKKQSNNQDASGDNNKKYEELIADLEKYSLEDDLDGLSDFSEDEINI